MRILLVHNYYQQPGGEDVVFSAEADLLRENGHEVVCYTDHNRRIRGMNSLGLAVRTLWSRETGRQLREILRENRFEVAHFHNTFPLVSPSAYQACREAGVPVVQTLHNYRLLCPAATFFREGHICEECLGKTIPWPAVWHACYRNSRTQSTVAATMLTVHKGLKTWVDKVDLFIALTEFARSKFIQGGIPAEKIRVKPHFVEPDPGPRRGVGEYALFVGRLTPEKGIRTLLEAWKGLPQIPLKIVGDGPLKEEIRKTIEQDAYSQVHLVGHCKLAEVTRHLKRARFLVFPSEWFETFGQVVIEAFACGVPVLAARVGSASELVANEETGLHFPAGNPVALQRKVAWAWRNAHSLKTLGEQARRRYERSFSARPNYLRLMGLYQEAVTRCTFSGMCGSSRAFAPSS